MWVMWSRLVSLGHELPSEPSWRSVQIVGDQRSCGDRGPDQHRQVGRSARLILISTLPVPGVRVFAWRRLSRYRVFNNGTCWGRSGISDAPAAESSELAATPGQAPGKLRDPDPGSAKLNCHVGRGHRPPQPR
jgi:hypothetical protein